MRVLLLIDYPMHPHAQRDLDFALTQLDSDRIQLHVCSLRGESPQAQYSLAARTPHDLQAALRLHRLVESLDIELIHVLDAAPLTVAALVTFVHQLPLLVTIYHMQPRQRESWLQWTLFRRYWALLRRIISRLIVHSEITKRQVWLIAGFPRDKIDVMYPPHAITIDPALTRADYEFDSGPLVAVITPDEPDDGYDLVLESVTRLMQRVPDVTFVFAGEHKIIVEWQRKMGRIRPTAPIRWIVDPPSVVPIIALSDLVIAHPHHEGWVEALALAGLCGKPVVAARLGGVTEIVETTITGLLITPDDVRDLSLQATRLLTQPEFAARLGAQAKVRVTEMLSPELARDTLMTMYEATIYSTR